MFRKWNCLNFKKAKKMKKIAPATANRILCVSFVRSIRNLVLAYSEFRLDLKGSSGRCRRSFYYPIAERS